MAGGLAAHPGHPGGALVNNAGIEEHHVVAKIEYTRWQAAWQRILGTQAPDFPTGCIVDVNGACYLRS